MASRGRLLVVNWQDLQHPLAGGAEVHLQENLRRLVQLGFDVTLLCSTFEGGDRECTWEGVRILRRGGRFDFNWRVPGLVRQLVREQPFDLVVEDINKIPFYTPLYQPVPVLALVPHMFATTVFHEINFLLASYIYLCEYPVRWAYRKVPFCVISESTRQDLLGRGFAPDQVKVIHCGLDATLYRTDANVPKSASPTVLFLGRLKKYKCVQHLIAAFARVAPRVPGAQLIVVGDGDYREALEAQALSLGLSEQVQFTGFVRPAEKVRFLQEAWVAVCPSLKEGWGLTNIEANACGTAVIAADVPGLRDSVQHGSNGFLYPHGDLDALSTQLVKVLSEQGTRQQLEQGGVAWAQRFDWDDGAKQLASELDRAIARGKGTR